MIHILRADLKRPGQSRQESLELRGAIHDLDKRLSLLRDAYLELLASDKDQIPGRWRKLMALYDDFCDEARQCRLRIAGNGGEDVTAGTRGPVNADSTKEA